MVPISKVSRKPFQRLAGRGQQCQQLKMLRFPVNCAAIHLGAPSIAGRPSPKNDPPDRFIGFTPAELLKQGISHSAECDQRAPPFGNLRAFEKARPKLLFRLRRVRLKLLALLPLDPANFYIDIAGCETIKSPIISSRGFPRPESHGCGSGFADSPRQHKSSRCAVPPCIRQRAHP